MEGAQGKLGAELSGSSELEDKLACPDVGQKERRKVELERFLMDIVINLCHIEL